ncbi:glycine oxidase ThiO [Arthrobacter sp. MYb227]|uniref:glycine oxidase ThiO n=1 Tax=Arthrobacter sp. MYb227 TaxID=1848601 RepID=UPI000CFB7303|nr:glycine oxidase ThiO [Arthrobacter sp. MYb227]PQZ95183.1 glycine oxidase ThiO [Arthrobacter sp. MYb227]
MPLVHVAIVGAGIIGLATALELRSRGATITLIDPAPGLGASHAAAGMLAPSAETTWGQGKLNALLSASARAYPEFIDAVQLASGVRPAFIQNSTLVVAAQPADREALVELIDLQDSLGLPVKRLLGTEARALEPALAANIAGAVLCPDDHQVDPRSLITILLEALKENLLVEPVAGLLRVGERTIGVRTGSGTNIHADQVLLATGMGQIPGVPRLPIRPVYGEILRVQGSAEHPLLRHTVRGIVHRRPVYLVPRADGSLVLGASSREDGDARVNLGEVTTLLENARRLVPGIVDTTLNEVIARARPTTFDDIPLLGRLDEGLVISTGYSRHGVLLTPLGARLGAQLLLGEPFDAQLAGIVDPHRLSSQDFGIARTHL